MVARLTASTLEFRSPQKVWFYDLIANISIRRLRQQFIYHGDLTLFPTSILTDAIQFSEHIMLGEISVIKLNATSTESQLNLSKQSHLMAMECHKVLNLHETMCKICISVTVIGFLLVHTAQLKSAGSKLIAEEINACVPDVLYRFKTIRSHTRRHTHFSFTRTSNCIPFAYTEFFFTQQQKTVYVLV